MVEMTKWSDGRNDNVETVDMTKSQGCTEGGIGSRKGKGPTVVGRTTGCTALGFYSKNMSYRLLGLI